MKLLQLKNLLMFVLISGILFYIPVAVFARGGGGGGKGGGALGWLEIILIPIIIIYMVIITYYLRKRHSEAKNLANKIERQDPIWSEGKIKYDVEKTFYMIQEAWMERNQDIAKDYMSESLYNTHKAQTDAMIASNRKNILEKVKLKDVKLVEVEDFKDDTNDNFWVYITGSMIDYIINDETEKVISGDYKKPEKFHELWRFMRGSDRWVLDEIESKDILSNLMKFESFSEEVTPTMGNGYMVCDKCAGYYKLQKGESPYDFDVCQCGGNLMYYKDIDNFFNEYNDIFGGNRKIQTKVYKSVDPQDLNNDLMS